MKKKIWAVVFVVIVIIGIVVGAVVNRVIKDKQTENPAVTEETAMPPELRMQYPDRLDGALESNYETEDNTIKITYGKKGTLQRVFASDELMHSEREYTEKVELEIGTNTVTLSGKNGRIYTAAWIENYNSYFIELNPEGAGVDADEMQEYVLAAE